MSDIEMRRMSCDSDPGKRFRLVIATEGSRIYRSWARPFASIIGDPYYIASLDKKLRVIDENWTEFTCDLSHFRVFVQLASKNGMSIRSCAVEVFNVGKSPERIDCEKLIALALIKGEPENHETLDFVKLLGG